MLRNIGFPLQTILFHHDTAWWLAMKNVQQLKKGSLLLVSDDGSKSERCGAAMILCKHTNEQLWVPENTVSTGADPRKHTAAHQRDPKTR
jgi:hypothetical protein